MSLEIPVYLFSAWWLSLGENIYYIEALKGEIALRVRAGLCLESYMGLAVCHYSQILL